MRIQTLAAAAVLSLAATIPLSTAAFAEPPNPHCFKVGDLEAEVNGRHCLPDVDPVEDLKPGDPHKPWMNPCRGLVHGIIDDEKLHEVTDKVQERLRDDKPCRDDEPEHKRRHARRSGRQAQPPQEEERRQRLGRQREQRQQRQQQQVGRR